MGGFEVHEVEGDHRLAFAVEADEVHRGAQGLVGLVGLLVRHAEGFQRREAFVDGGM